MILHLLYLTSHYELNVKVLGFGRQPSDSFHVNNSAKLQPVLRSVLQNVRQEVCHSRRKFKCSVEIRMRVYPASNMSRGVRWVNR